MGYIKTNNSKVTLGTNPQEASMIFKTDGPLDDRTALATRASLISKQALGARKANNDTELEIDANIKNWVYPAMTCAVQETGEIYVLKDKAALQLYTDAEIAAMTDAQIEAHINKAWTRQALRSDLESITSAITGVFQFKGAAFAISPDNTYILLNGDGFDVEPIGTACDIVGNTYFGWKIDMQEMWTTGPLWENAVEYTKSDTSTTVYGMTIDGTLYFVSNTQPDTTQGTLLESLDGRCVWLDSGSGSIEGWYTDLNPLGVQVCNKEGELTDEFVYGYVFKYNAYVFTESEEKVGCSFYVTPLLASDGTKTDGDGNKIPNNSGHVYQIGENEYASNGQIWVKLGAPTENWIIL